MHVKVKKVLEGAKIPSYQTEGSSGMDLLARLDTAIKLAPGQRKLVPTGIALAMSGDVEAQIRPRSGHAVKLGLTVLNSPGTIDSDYRGHIQVLLINQGDEDIKIENGDRIAQIVFLPVVRVKLDLVDSLDDTDRGTGGFGSTGTK